MHLDEILLKAEKIKKAFDHIEEKRKFWRDETKPLLQKVLRQIAQEASYLDLQVQTLDWTVNCEGVNLLFNTRPSGLYTNPEPSDLPIRQDRRLYIKEGGYIVFGQGYNGEIIVLISYPSVEEHVTQAENKFLGKVRPSDIDENFIYEKVSTFFDEMLKWETDSSSRSIGFTNSHR